MFNNYLYDPISQKHSFDIKDMDLSIANSIRRIILTEIPVVGFYGEDEPTQQYFQFSDQLNDIEDHSQDVVLLDKNKRWADF